MGIIRLSIILVSLLWAATVLAEDLQRYSIEFPENFALRNLREGEELAYKVIEGVWNDANVIVSFARRTSNSKTVTKSDSYGLTEIIGRVYLGDSLGLYKEYLIDTIREEGGAPIIVGAGFLNADSDPENELVIVISWEQKHYEVSGALYDVSFYDNIIDKTNSRLVYKRNISEQFAPECECRWSEGRRGKAKFKTLADVEKELKRLKFRQFYRSNYE